MLNLHHDPHSGWRYTHDNLYAIHKTNGKYLRWCVRKLVPDGSYRVVNFFYTLKEAREYLEQLPIYNAPQDGV